MSKSSWVLTLKKLRWCGVHAIDVVFFHVGDPDLFEKQGDLQVIALQPLLYGLKAALRIYGVKGLGPSVQPRHHDVIVGGHVQHEAEQVGVEEGHVAGNHDSVVATSRREAGEYAAQRPAVRVDVGGSPDPGREVQGPGPRLLSDDYNRLGAYLGEPVRPPARSAIRRQSSRRPCSSRAACSSPQPAQRR